MRSISTWKNSCENLWGVQNLFNNFWKYLVHFFLVFIYGFRLLVCVNSKDVLFDKKEFRVISCSCVWVCALSAWKDWQQSELFSVHKQKQHTKAKQSRLKGENLSTFHQNRKKLILPWRWPNPWLPRAVTCAVHLRLFLNFLRPRQLAWVLLVSLVVTFLTQKRA